MEWVLPSSVAASYPYQLLELIKDTFPWLWEMKDLISEHPNITPVGLGNSESTFNMSGYEARYRTDGDNSKPASDEDDEDNAPEGEDNDNDNDNNRATISCKCPACPTSKKKAVQVQKMKAPKADSHRNKKSKVLDHYANLASAKEVTNQKELDFKKAWMENASVKIKGKVEIQIQRDKLKAGMRMLQKK